MSDDGTCHVKGCGDLAPFAARIKETGVAVYLCRKHVPRPGESKVYTYLLPRSP